MGHDGEITSVVYSDNGNTFLTAGGDGLVKMWDSISGNTRSVLRGMTGAALTVAISTASDIVAAGSTDKSATIWSTSTSRIRHTCTGHGGKVNSVTFFRNRSTLATAS
jgi:WD40 repeat protein